MRISDWSSDVCSSDLAALDRQRMPLEGRARAIGNERNIETVAKLDDLDDLSSVAHKRHRIGQGGGKDGLVAAVMSPLGEAGGKSLPQQLLKPCGKRQRQPVLLPHGFLPARTAAISVRSNVINSTEERSVGTEWCSA